MKANETPEKIYLIRNFPSSTALNTTNDNHRKFLDEWYMSREKDADVEYIRADILIEKAVKFFIPYIRDNSGGYDRAAVIENFKNYMKGE